MLSIIGGSGSGKRTLIHISNIINLINHQSDIDLYAKDPFEAKYQLLSNKRESKGLKHLNNFETFIEYSNDIDYISKKYEEQNPNKKRKVLIVFDDMIAGSLVTLNPIVTKLFIKIIINYFSCFYYTALFCCTKKLLD